MFHLLSKKNVSMNKYSKSPKFFEVKSTYTNLIQIILYLYVDSTNITLNGQLKQLENGSY